MPKLIKYKLVVFVPTAYLKKVSDAIFQAGAGRIGNYERAAFLSAGTGTFRPLLGAKPFRGKVGKSEKVREIRLETIVTASKIKPVIAALLATHPYETPAYDVYPLSDY
jgi:hypothetical protein